MRFAAVTGLLAIFTAVVVSSFAANLPLSPASASIEGKLVALDDTPHVAVPVQVLKGQEIIATALSDAHGGYRIANLAPDTYQIRCHVQGGFINYAEGQAVALKPGEVRQGIDFRFAPFKKGTWKKYTTLDGLAHNTVFCIYQDRQGMMWFGTYGGGVSRYDGKTFKNFTMADGLVGNEIVAFCEGNDGSMWIGTQSGLSKYTDGQFTNFTAQNEMGNAWIWSVYQTRDGDVWIGTEGHGVYRYDGTRFVNFNMQHGLPGNTVKGIIEDGNGDLWLGCSEPVIQFLESTDTGRPTGKIGGLARYDGQTFESFTTANGLVSNTVWDVERGHDGALWMCTAGGVSRYDGHRFKNYTKQDGLAHNWVRHIHNGQDGAMWFTTWGGGISRFDGVSFVNFTTDDGLPSNWANDLYHAADGGLWIGTGFPPRFEPGGLTRYEAAQFTRLTPADGLVNAEVQTVFFDTTGILWIGTAGGVSRYHNGRFTNFTTADGLAGNVVWSIESDGNGMVWFGTKGGASRYDGRQFQNFNADNGLHTYVNAIHRSPTDDKLWFGTGWYRDGGVVRYDGEKFSRFTAQDTMPYNYQGRVIATARDGTLWVGTRHGAFRYDGERFTHFTTAEGLAYDWVNAIFPDITGAVWLGTNQGVSRYHEGKLVNFSTDIGLAHNRVTAIYRTNDGRMWFGTDGGGITIYDGEAWSTLDTRDGLAGDRVTEINEDTDGHMWFGTSGGLTRYLAAETKPQVHIIAVKETAAFLFDKNTDPIPEKPLKVVAESLVTIRYHAIDFVTIADKRQYRTRILNTNAANPEASWSQPSKLEQVEWAPRQPGAYTFEVQAINRDLNYSEPARITLHVVPLWYKNLWIAGPIYGSFIGLLIFSVLTARRYLKQRQESARLREELLQHEQHERHTIEQKNVQLQQTNIELQEAKEAAEAANQAKGQLLSALQHEMQQAREMQQAFLPKDNPQLAGFDIAGQCESAREVGGDYFTYLWLDKAETQLGIVLMDVVGHSMKAAAMAFLANGMLQSEIRNSASPVEVMPKLNQSLRAVLPKNAFVAMSFAVIDGTNKQLTYFNAGVCKPILLRGGNFVDLNIPGKLPLGTPLYVDYIGRSVPLVSGDVLIFFSDGLPEARGADGRMYVEARMRAFLKSASNENGTAQQWIDAILSDVEQYTHPRKLDDDLTVVVARVL